MRRWAAIALAVLVATACLGLAMESRTPAAHARSTVTAAVRHVMPYPDAVRASATAVVAAAAFALWTLLGRERLGRPAEPVASRWRRRGPPTD